MAEPNKPQDKKGKPVEQPSRKTVTQQPVPNTTAYKAPPGQPPCPAPAPAPAPTAEPTTTELLQRIMTEHETFAQILEKLTAMASSLATAPKPEDKYYDTPQTVIAVATPNQPNSPDTFSSATTVPVTPGYQAETIYATLGRIAPKVTVINDGTTTLFVISSPEGKTWSSENTILNGEARTFYNVFELRLRSPTAGALGPPIAGGVYRVTERDYWLPYAKIISVGGSIIITLAATQLASLQNVALPAIGANWLGANLVPVNTPTTFRIMVAVSIAGTFSAVITNGGNTQTLEFNAVAGPALVAGALYIFTMLVASGDTVNFSYSATGGTIQKLIVEEVDAAVG